MLGAGEVRERLQQWQIPDARERRRARAAALQGDAREIALGCLGARAGDDEAEPAAARRDRAAERLAAAPPAVRQQVFEALFPTLAPHVEAAWRLFERLPYQAGYGRKAFRALRTLMPVRPARTEWVPQLLGATWHYEQDLPWYAAWAPHLTHAWDDALGILFAAAIDAGGPTGDAVFEILTASARGEHEIGAMGRHVTRGLLAASRPEGWELVEKLLLAAQRQEGLRRTILETVDEAHPVAFRRMLRLLLDQNLIRFSACLRAVDVWFGFGWEVEQAKRAAAAVAQALRFLDDADARAAALAAGDAEAAYLALWATAFEDAWGAVEPAARLLTDPAVERRFAGASLLSQLGLVGAQAALLPALGDADLRVALTAFQAVRHGAAPAVQAADLFERLEALLARCPAKKQELPELVWPWVKPAADRPAVAGALLRNLGDRSPKRLLPHLAQMAPDDRGWMIGILTGTGSPYLPSDERSRRLAELAGDWAQDAESRATLLALTADASSTVRELALLALAHCQVTAEEAQSLERRLTHKAAGTRRGVLAVLLNQADDAALTSTARLLAAKDTGQRLAGLELLQQMAQAERRPEACRQQAAAYGARHPTLGDPEARLLEGLRQRRPAAAAATLEDALGLMDPAQRTRPVPPREIPYVRLVTPAAVACLRSLDELIDRHWETPVVLHGWDGSRREELLGNLTYGFGTHLTEGGGREELPLADLWESWWRSRPEALRDADGFELLRALASRPQTTGWETAVEALALGDRPPELKRTPLVLSVLAWLLGRCPPEGGTDFLLDALETSLAELHREIQERKPDPEGPLPAGMYGLRHRLDWLELARDHRRLFPTGWQDAHHARLWRLLRWVDEPLPNALRLRPQLEEVLAAYRAGAATEADLLDQLLGPRGEARPGYYTGVHFDDLRRLTGHKGSPLFAEFPILRELIDRCRERIIAVECGRGDLPTAAARPAQALRYAGGLAALTRLLAALGPEPFTRNWSWWGGGQSRSEVFSHLIRATVPAETDTLAAFAERLAGVPPRRLVELAMFAPQWSSHVEHALGWPGLAEGVWWIHAHTKDLLWAVDADIREAWSAETAERTPLSAQSLLDGAVDVAWFRRCYGALGAERWAELDRAARYASGGGGHKRAQLFADAMLGRVTKAELADRVTRKRHQDAVRALGLVPLAAGAAGAADLLERYQLVQEFIRGSRQFGSQRQASEKLAAGVALENLARTAGYPDPIRLEWAMEAQAVADLAAGPVSAAAGDVTVTLSIDPWGQPELAVTRGGKALKAIPAAAKKAPEIAALQERKREIERQAARMRRSLEAAMCRGDRFTGAELRELLGHPVLAPMLRNLVFMGDVLAGYPVEGGAALEDAAGRRQPVPDRAELRLAHPHDLLGTGEWHRWQQDCFRRERIQPFKQVFRELYVLTTTEAEDGARSHRYQGHQVNPRQAMALLGQRGWVTHPEEGVRRVFHAEGIAAWVEFDQGFFTPAEVEGLTVESVAFARRGEWQPLPLSAVPPRLFSEAMRDVDLMVSVAHQGGVDPEASASTVEMRAALLRESCALWKLENVRLQGAHALIEGELATYSVHLGSAIVHRQPGSALCIVPVHGQHRGRLFLPFADDDPKTAELLAKVLLLARDREIKDPTILEQILRW